MTLSTTALPKGTVQYALPPYCIYFLLCEGEVVYVGKTGRLGVRTEHHRDGTKNMPPKVFDEVQFLAVSKADAPSKERYWIRTLQPRYNINGKTVGAHRPREGEWVVLYTEVRPHLKAWLEAQAEANHRSAASELITLLETHLDPKHQPKKGKVK